MYIAYKQDIVIRALIAAKYINIYILRRRDILHAAATRIIGQLGAPSNPVMTSVAAMAILAGGDSIEISRDYNGNYKDICKLKKK